MTRARVLFVDDSQLMRLSSRKLLAPHFDVILADNAIRARELLDEDPLIQVVFCDLNMPGQSGYELLAELRSAPVGRLRDLPLIIVTGADNQEAEREKALNLGATDFINKPFRASELLARARAHASHEEAVGRLRRLEGSHPFDPVTGLGSFAYCVRRLEQAMSFALRHHQALTLVHLHLIGLEKLIAELGEPYATSALTKIGRVMTQSIRCEDTVFRTGVESFCFMLPATDAAGAGTLKNRFIPNLEELGLRPDGAALEVQCGFSIHCPDLESCADAEQVLRAGMARDTIAVDPAERSPKTAARLDHPDIEQALALLDQGDIEAVQAQLPALLERLHPLLKLARQQPVGRGRLPLAGNEA
ncbi:MAG: response regulator [Gammaproteobacteria bacterium]|nr:response regulator [Gammaproteobacteria bacterium]